jgi:hydroxymethylpyrimidine/phosphomethylpyrimidine kinase
VVVVEEALHATLLPDLGVDAATVAATAVAPTTRAYTSYLLATALGGSFAEGLAAVLPCYWIYAEVGAALHARHVARPEKDAHPYGAWIGTYADEAFAAATRRAIAYTDAAGRRASVAERTAMREAFAASTVYEREFFDAPRRFA